MSLDRTGARSLALAGARLLTALLPMLALGALRLVPEIRYGALQDWVEPAFLVAAAVLGGVALALAFADALRSGRTRTLADAIGLGMVGVTLAAVALDGSALIAAAAALTAGLSAAGVVFLAGSFLVGSAGSRGRVAVAVTGLIAIQATAG
ncbi:MAG: hypothetical protein ABIQ05_06260, partial [Candidatus Limnocylindria bacterium]